MNYDRFSVRVNELRELSKKYAHTEQLREQLAKWLRDFVIEVEKTK